jgi:hypothetical protein
MVQAARQAINSIPRQPPAYSLVIAAPDYDEASIGDDWVAGVAWSPEGCGGGGRLATTCVGDTTAMSATSRSGATTITPFLVYAADECSATGFQAADYIGRAGRLLANTQSFQIAEELWDGSLAGQLGNTALASTGADVLSAGAVTVLEGIGLIEAGIAHYGHGVRGMIHVTPQVLHHAHADGGLERAGGAWVTAMGNIVVADAGYSGNGVDGQHKAGATQWIYGTEVIPILMGPVGYLPVEDLATDPAGFMAGALDRATNTVRVYANRFAGWLWDECIHVAAEVNIKIPAFGP